MEHCKSAKTLLSFGIDLNVNRLEPVRSNICIRQFVDASHHQAITVGSDIAYAVSFLARLMHKPTAVLWVTSKSVLSYLLEYLEHGLCFQKEGKMVIIAYSDAYWGYERPSRKSISENLLACAGSLINWRSKQPAVVARSLKILDFVASESCFQDVLWMRKFKQDIAKILDNFWQSNFSTFFFLKPINH